MDSKTRAYAVVFALLAVLALPVTAAPVIFFGEDLAPTPGTPASNFPNATAARDAFVSALNEAFVYDAETPFISSPGPVTFVGPSGMLNATGFGDLATGGFGSAFTISGTNVIGGTEGFTIRPDENLIAVGIFGLAQPSQPTGVFVTPIRIELTYLDDAEETFMADEMTLGLRAPSIAFFGVIADQPFDQFIIRGTVTPSQDLLWDDIIIASSLIPEPPTIALFGIGIGLFLFGWRRDPLIWNARRRRAARPALA